jgi:hypothetical protein
MKSFEGIIPVKLDQHLDRELRLTLNFVLAGRAGVRETPERVRTTERGLDHSMNSPQNIKVYVKGNGELLP